MADPRKTIDSNCKMMSSIAQSEGNKPALLFNAFHKSR